MKPYKQFQFSHFKNALLALLFISIILVSCKKDDDTPPEKNFTYLVESQFIAAVNKTTVLTLANTYPEVYAVFSTKNLSDVSVFKLTYKTKNVAGEEIIASGVVIVPSTSGALPLFSYQHGTLFTYAEAPSRYSTGIETKGLATIIASAGYAVSVPDYLGYGASESYPHPYEHAKTLGSASFDMLMATKEFLDDNSIALSDKLFITGYSEGGNATMALHQYIEENSDLVITMSAPASGAYNKTAFAKDILQRNEDLDFLPRFMWVFDAYNWIYDLNRSWSDFVNEPYASTLDAVIDPFKLADAAISHNPQTLFKTSTIDGVINGTDTDLLAALADNDNFDWIPEYPITLYYGTADDYVFPLNTLTAYDALTLNGATVSKVAYEGADHTSAIIPYFIDMFELFESLK